MGKRNSSLTRVLPVFQNLYTNEPSGKTWLPTLLQAMQGGSAFPDVLQGNLGDIEKIAFGNNEQKLAAPRKLLAWLLAEVDPVWGAKTLDRNRSLSRQTREWREALLNRNTEILKRALDKLEAADLFKPAWYILEGPSQPDLFIQTERLILVIEGKRTEWGPTNSTEYMPVRPQILRHLDAAWEIRGERQVLGGFIIEGEKESPFQVPETWKRACQDTPRNETLEAALPHRSLTEKQALGKSFLGAVTWQNLCQRTGLAFTSLPDQVEEVSA